ncbi:MAG TPA: KEOPS complex subunit Pcc1 [Thermoplasmata archaeon]|nr:KEOPS complex subunit Pcc1 [Thermoplasmata archaeon]
MHKATIVLEHPKATVIEKTIRPESAVEIPRTSVMISRHEDKVKIDIESGDVNGLRAAVNSYLRWMEMAAKISERTGE